MKGVEKDMRKACPKAKFGKGGAFAGAGIRKAGGALKNWLDEVIAVRKQPK